ncbi:repulsive guidance molecule B [Serinus canaria]|uniref:Repulsive guidance molecule BMP co-receptor b n=1 Tax=Serinus canaria TaxID=9135 RepID=A0A8C9UB84_SERCA|nr:repulsive guidance molecule B [Serinus canaria]
MGSAVPSRAPRAEAPLAAFRRLLAALGLLLLRAGDCKLHTSCGIQKCTTDFVSFTSHLNTALEDFDLEFCKALRAYSVCTYRNSKVCRGNLVYHSAVLGISDLMTQRNCTKTGPTSSTNSEMTHDPCNYSGHTEAREHQRGEKTPPPTYLFCGLFGDPHLRTFKDRFQTCKVEGAWPLIDNKYLSVQVTNVPVVPGSSATATNKITIIFKSYQDCTDQKVYQAMTDDLPAAFVDGTTSGGDENTRSLHIVEKVNGKYIEMHARYIGTTVYIRQLGHYLTLAIRMPQELVMAFEENQDLQLCVNGCPSTERIDPSGHLPLPVMGKLLPWGAASHPQSGYTLETATTKCHEKMLVKDIYFYSCVFDLLTTGDDNFTAAAHSALQDVEALHPSKERWHIFPRSGDDGVGRDSKFFVSLGLLCLILVAYLYDSFFRL